MILSLTFNGYFNLDPRLLSILEFSHSSINDFIGVTLSPLPILAMGGAKGGRVEPSKARVVSSVTTRSDPPMLVGFMPPNAILRPILILIESFDRLVESGLELAVGARKIEGCDAEVLDDHFARTLGI